MNVKIIGVYAPQADREEEANTKFYDVAQNAVDAANTGYGWQWEIGAQDYREGGMARRAYWGDMFWGEARSTGGCDDRKAQGAIIGLL